MGPGSRCVTLLIALKSSWLPGHLQPVWYFLPLLYQSSLKFVSPSQCTCCFCVLSFDSYLSVHEETEARPWCNDLPDGYYRAELGLEPWFWPPGPAFFFSMPQVAQHMLLVFSAGFVANSPPRLDVPRG